MSKPNLILFHGALATKNQFNELIDYLSDTFNCYPFECEGHGKSPLTNQSPTLSSYAEQIINFITEQKIDKPNLFGYSMGGYIAQIISLQKPDLIGKVATLATKIYWTQETVERESKLLDAEKIQEKIPAFAQKLAEEHTALGWKNLLTLTQSIIQDLADKPYLNDDSLQTCSIPTLILIGDQDKTASLEESQHASAILQKSVCEVIPNTPHPFEKVSALYLSHRIKNWYLFGI